MGTGSTKKWILVDFGNLVSRICSIDTLVRERERGLRRSNVLARGRLAEAAPSQYVNELAAERGPLVQH